MSDEPKTPPEARSATLYDLEGLKAAWKVERSALENAIASLRARVGKLEKRAGKAGGG